ncbi:MAG: hypothetical protein HQK74_09865 [Desulfamplus sp.]|nr:hypothetical protein [Desulfamplus sp.]MBF0209831.1 hypothetical protein [Desulfamplus sp.]MBF0230900.1 hypothetical protein [Desulfamplus sp.]MBF0390403.1 hypothetical protein [Desulfamplus sp.]
MEEEKGEVSENKTNLFDNPKNVKRLLTVFFTSLLILFMIDFFIHKHGHFEWENWPGFYAVFGFVACVIVIFTAKLLRVFSKRDERYYD